MKIQKIWHLLHPNQWQSAIEIFSIAKRLLYHMRRQFGGHGKQTPEFRRLTSNACLCGHKTTKKGLGNKQYHFNTARAACEYDIFALALRPNNI